jgi:hypothetical protein
MSAARFGLKTDHQPSELAGTTVLMLCLQSQLLTLRSVQFAICNVGRLPFHCPESFARNPFVKLLRFGRATRYQVPKSTRLLLPKILENMK